MDDGCGEVSRIVGPGVTVLAQAHSGPAAARNLGVRHARGDIVLFTDSDCEPSEDWIEQMTAAFADANVIGVKGAYRTKQKSLVARFVQSEYDERYARMFKRSNIDFIDTYSAGYRRDTLLHAGAFDPVYPTASVEDQDLSFRLSKLGHRMVFNPRAVVYHLHPSSLWAYFRRKFKIGFWKVVVLSRFPGKALQDAHTPHALKAQVVLLWAALILAFVGAWRRPAWLIMWSLCGAFLVTTLPLTVRAWRCRKMAVAVYPFLLSTRALALGLGLGVGVVVHAGRLLRKSPRGFTFAAHETGLRTVVKPDAQDKSSGAARSSGNSR